MRFWIAAASSFAGGCCSEEGAGVEEEEEAARAKRDAEACAGARRARRTAGRTRDMVAVVCVVEMKEATGDEVDERQLAEISSSSDRIIWFRRSAENEARR